MTGFSEHRRMIYLDRKLFLAILQLQADKNLGNAFGALLPFVVGLHHIGYVSDSDFEIYENKYSVPLDAEVLTPEQIKQKETKENRNRQLNRHYKEVFEQWDNLKEKSKLVHLKKAEEDKHLKWAKKVLNKGKQEREAQK